MASGANSKNSRYCCITLSNVCLADFCSRHILANDGDTDLPAILDDRVEGHLKAAAVLDAILG